jgi:UDP-N-acetylmuramate: L-alanyl-gamma-D-glutamyl-meso-diaminopimelate ligase
MSGSLHILGVGGTFMAGLARIAVEAGFSVRGADANVYPPMDGQLRSAGIDFLDGYREEDLPRERTEGVRIIVGNVMRRGLPVVEAMLERSLDYVSGPQWLAETILPGRWVIAASGTHGKTTTSSLIAYILDAAGLEPGFLIGGVPENFAVSARLGQGPFFVVEADEYDCAFFDKRAKFVHYRPRTLVINQIEFDHADIYPDLAAIERQFHHLLRTVPGQGLIVAEARVDAIDRVLEQGCWTPVMRFGEGELSGLSAVAMVADASSFRILDCGREVGQVSWAFTGRHNMRNAVAALAAARHAGVPLDLGIRLLPGFLGVRRRQQTIGDVQGIRVLDDFAHHPTAIAATLEGLRPGLQPGARLIALVEPGSHSMRRQVHGAALLESLLLADLALLHLPPEIAGTSEAFLGRTSDRVSVYPVTQDLLDATVDLARPGDCIIIMSNGAFDALHQRLLAGLERRWHDGTQ